MLKPTFPYTDRPRPSLPLLWCPWPPHGQNGMWSHLFRMQLLSSVMLGCLLSAGRPECIWEPLNGAVSAEAGRWAWEEAACCTHTYTPSSLQRLLDPPCRDGQVNQNEKGTGTETGTGKPQNAMKDWKSCRLSHKNPDPTIVSCLFLQALVLCKNGSLDNSGFLRSLETSVSGFYIQ